MRKLWIDNGYHQQEIVGKPQYLHLIEEIRKFVSSLKKEDVQLEIVLTGDCAGKVITPKKGHFPVSWETHNEEVVFSNKEQGLFDYNGNTIIATMGGTSIKIIKGRIMVVASYVRSIPHVYYEE